MLVFIPLRYCNWPECLMFNIQAGNVWHIVAECCRLYGLITTGQRCSFWHHCLRWKPANSLGGLGECPGECQGERRILEQPAQPHFLLPFWDLIINEDHHLGVVALQAIKRLTRNKFRLWRDVNCCEQLELRETIGNLSNLRASFALISCRSEGFVHAACRSREVLTCSHSVSWSPCDILQKLSFQELQRSASRSCSFHGNNNTWNNALPECGNYPTVQNITLELTQVVCGSVQTRTEVRMTIRTGQLKRTWSSDVATVSSPQARLLPAGPGIKTLASSWTKLKDNSWISLENGPSFHHIPPNIKKYLMSARFWPIPISCLI